MSATSNVGCGLRPNDEVAPFHDGNFRCKRLLIIDELGKRTDLPPRDPMYTLGASPPNVLGLGIEMAMTIGFVTSKGRTTSSGWGRFNASTIQHYTASSQDPNYWTSWSGFRDAQWAAYFERLHWKLPLSFGSALSR
jgi:hypothetical protein